jgi:hypothetical protein
MSSVSRLRFLLMGGLLARSHSHGYTFELEIVIDRECICYEKVILKVFLTLLLIKGGMRAHYI